jgi:cytochrome c-type biogenesis protein CcmE
MKFFRSSPWTYALLAGALSLAIPMFATSQEPAQTPHDQGQSQQRDNGQATENSFAGRITKGNKGKLMLVDPSKSTSFQLDNQALAKKYEGKNVVVTGTLDEANNILHVKKIDLAA